MKKHLLFLIMLFSCASLFAQDSDVAEIKIEELRDLLPKISDYKNDNSGQTPWQLLFIMNSAKDLKWGAVDDNRKAIEQGIKKGLIARGAILYAREDGTTYLNIFPKQGLADNFNPSDTAKYDYIKIDTSDITENDLFMMLFKSHQKDIILLWQ